jgi:hypothetical protein
MTVRCSERFGRLLAVEAAVCCSAGFGWTPRLEPLMSGLVESGAVLADDLDPTVAEDIEAERPWPVTRLEVPGVPERHHPPHHPGLNAGQLLPFRGSRTEAIP